MLFRRSGSCAFDRTGAALRDPLRYGIIIPGVLVLLLLAVIPSANAPILFLDDMPFFAKADSTSRLALITEINRFEDQKFGWSANRLLATIVLPAGEKAVYFVRMPYTSFDHGGVSLKSRWPWVLGNSEVKDWPNGERVTSFGQLEMGVTGPLNFSFFSDFHYSAALGLPVGTDRLYPFSSISMPLRFEFRKNIPWGLSRQISLQLGYLDNMNSSMDFLNEESAFPSGFHLGGAFNWYRGRNSRLAMSYDYHNREGRRSQLVGLQAWVPWTENGSVGFKASRELQGSLDRPAAWYFTVSFRLDSNKYRPNYETAEA